MYTETIHQCVLLTHTLWLYVSKLIGHVHSGVTSYIQSTSFRWNVYAYHTYKRNVKLCESFMLSRLDLKSTAKQYYRLNQLDLRVAN